MRRLSLTLLALWPLAVAATTESSTDPETGLVTWQTETAGIQVRLTQISQTRRAPSIRRAGFPPRRRNAMPPSVSS